EAEGFFFVAKFFFFGPLVQRRHSGLCVHGGHRQECLCYTKERHLSALFFIFRPLRRIRSRFELLKQRAASKSQEIKGSRLDQRLEHLLVARAQIDFLAELQQRRESSDPPP